MTMAIKYVTMFDGYDYTKGLEQINPKAVNPTVQDAIVDIPSLFEAFNGHLKDLFDNYDNRCVYESQLGPVFVDTLSKESLDRYNQYLADKAAKEAEAKQLEQDFEAWREAKAREVLQGTPLTGSTVVPPSDTTPS